MILGVSEIPEDFLQQIVLVMFRFYFGIVATV
jgi:hypothetical protein